MVVVVFELEARVTWVRDGVAAIASLFPTAFTRRCCQARAGRCKTRSWIPERAGPDLRACGTL